MSATVAGKPPATRSELHHNYRLNLVGDPTVVTDLLEVRS
jgi:hypothetical protein